MLAEIEKHERKEGLQKFMVAVWKGENAVKLLDLANAAGMTSAFADDLVERIDQAKGYVPMAQRLPQLRREAAAAQEKMKKTESFATAEISRLEEQMEDAVIAASFARKAVCDADEAAKKLLELYDLGVLVPDLPKEVNRLMARRTAESTLHTAENMLNMARDERNRCQRTVDDIQNSLRNMPIQPPLDHQQTEKRLKVWLKDAQATLAKAESKFKKAQNEAAAARRAVATL